MSRRVGVGGAALGALILLTAGCVGVPDSSAVFAGSAVRAQQSPPDIQFEAERPHPGDSPRQIVQGFLDAMVSYQPGFPVARAFLAPAERATWRPESGIVVYDDGSGQPVRGARVGHIKLAVNQVARVSARGAWTTVPPGTRYRLDFGLRTVNGQWRITNPPTGLLISDFFFTLSYEAHNLYFFNPGFDLLVPDPVFLPREGQTATLLAQALLRGPTPWLAPAVRTVAPRGTEVGVSVPVGEAGVAQVELSQPVFGLSRYKRRLLAAQLAWTLAEVPDVTGTRITVDGAPLGIRGDERAMQVADFAEFDPAVPGASTTLYAVRGGRVVSDETPGLGPVAGALGRMPLARSVAVDLPGQRAAVVSADGTALAVGRLAPGSGEPRVGYAGRDLLPPSWDRTHQLWAVDARPGGARLLLLSGDRVHRLRVPGVSGSTVEALRVSRDGARLAVLVRRGGITRLVLARIVRGGPGGEGLAVSGAHVVHLGLRSIQGLAWASPTEVAVLARELGGVRQPYLVTVDGSTVTGASAPAALRPAAVAVGPTPGALLAVGTVDDEIWHRDADFRWSPLGTGSAPVYPG